MTEASNAVERSYEYEIKSTAEGGATALTNGSMLIEKVCVASLVEDFSKAYSVDIPELYSVIVYYPVNSTDYVTAPPYPVDNYTYGLPAAYECN